MDQKEIRRELTIVALINLNEDYNNALEDPGISQDEKEFLISCIQEITIYLDELTGDMEKESGIIKRPKWDQE